MRIKKKWAACILSMLLIFPGSVFMAGPDFASAEPSADAPLVATGDATMPIAAVIIATAALAVWLVIGVWKFLLPRKKK